MMRTVAVMLALVALCACSAPLRPCAPPSLAAGHNFAATYTRGDLGGYALTQVVFTVDGKVVHNISDSEAGAACERGRGVYTAALTPGEHTFGVGAWAVGTGLFEGYSQRLTSGWTFTVLENRPLALEVEFQNRPVRNMLLVRYNETGFASEPYPHERATPTEAEVKQSLQKQRVTDEIIREALGQAPKRL